MTDFLIIAVTQPGFYPEESERINEILSAGKARFVHIRKPDLSLSETEKLINGISSDFHKNLKLHDHFELLEKYDLGGIHLNSRNPEKYFASNSVSKSIHSIEEISIVEDLDYFFISPVFDSISKHGYKAAFDLNTLSEEIKGKKAIALGGVTPDKIPWLKSLGFYGAAMLGHFFPPLPSSIN